MAEYAELAEMESERDEECEGGGEEGGIVE